MTGNIWKSYTCTAVKKWDISDPRSYEHYWTGSWNETWKKFRPVRDLNQVVNNDFDPHSYESYTSLVLHVHSYEDRLYLISSPQCTIRFSYIYNHYSPLGRFIWIRRYDQLPDGSLAQLEERCTGIPELMGSNPVRAWIFSGLISATSLVVFIAARIAYISFLHRSADIWFSYISSHYSPLGRFLWVRHYD